MQNKAHVLDLYTNTTLALCLICAVLEKFLTLF